MRKSTAPNEVVYLSANHIASIEAASRGGSVVGTRKHNAFGASRGATGTMPTERGFTGRPHDATGLVYMNARAPAPRSRFDSAPRARYTGCILAGMV